MPDVALVGIPSGGGRAGTRRLRGTTGLLIATLATIALAPFSFGIAASHVYDHYLRQDECRRWQHNVNRWLQVVADSPCEPRPAETTALMLARGAMIAVRD